MGRLSSFEGPELVKVVDYKASGVQRLSKTAAEVPFWGHLEAQSGLSLFEVSLAPVS